MNTYTFTFAARVTCSADDMKKIDALLTGAGGEITKKDDWGKKTLSYPIKNQTEAKYLDYTLSLPASAIQSLRTKLQLNDNILRFLLVRSS